MALTVPKFYSPSDVDTVLQQTAGRAFPSSSPEDRAAGRARTRFGMHIDGKHTLLSAKGGLHRNHAVLSKDTRRTQFILDTQHDVWDAVSVISSHRLMHDLHTVPAHSIRSNRWRVLRPHSMSRPAPAKAQ